MSLGIPEKVECMELCLAVTKYLKASNSTRRALLGRAILDISIY